jgi:hypothetical protein
MNVTFKQYQLLPALTADLLPGGRSHRTFCPPARVEPKRQPRASAPAASTRLPGLPQRSRVEAGMLAVLSLGAALCLVQATLIALEGAPHWPQFQAWVARLIG